MEIYIRTVEKGSAHLGKSLSFKNDLLLNHHILQVETRYECKKTVRQGKIFTLKGYCNLHYDRYIINRVPYSKILDICQMLQQITLGEYNILKNVKMKTNAYRGSTLFYFSFHSSTIMPSLITKPNRILD